MLDSLDGMCPSCDNYYLPPIYQCPQGHTLCSHCTQDAHYMISTTGYNLRKPNLKSISKLKLFCGSCLNYYYTNEEMRNEVLEDSIRAVKYPCVYQKDGCQFEDLFSNIKRHNETCSFMVISCFWKNCFWTGVLSDMKDHLKYHSVLAIGLKQPFVNSSCFSVFCKDGFYIFKVTLTQKSAQFFVIYHGEPDEYRFEINISTKSGKNYPIKLTKVIPLLKNPKIHGLNFHNAENFFIDLDFVKQFFPVCIGEVQDEIQYMINIAHLDNSIGDCLNPPKKGPEL